MWSKEKTSWRPLTLDYVTNVVWIDIWSWKFETILI
jgi:hypothetical protein